MVDTRKAKKLKRPFKHFGFKCSACNITPIVGHLHRCVVCQDIHLCDPCFNSAAHDQHSFESRVTKTSPFLASYRTVPVALPTPFIRDIETRDLNEDDYETLLHLDTASIQGTIPLHILNRFPTMKIKYGDLRRCLICTQKFTLGEVVRKIPCADVFHQQCIGIKNL